MNEAGAEAILRLEELTRTYDSVTALDRLSLDVRSGEFLTLLGPSGCGKTTALRLIAGFDTADGGRIRFRDEDLAGWSPQKRGFGMVFQNYALFPHLDVFENVAFGLRARKLDGDRIRQRVEAALDTVDLTGYGGRAVQALSGGQQQRVALARALAIEPPLLLLDEPLSNLDQALRLQTRSQLRRLVKDLGITAVFVTHDQDEAFDLSDRIAVMRAGRIHQVGSPRTLYEEPADLFVASFVGRANRIPVEIGRDRIQVTPSASWPLTTESGVRGPIRAPQELAEGPGTLVVRPEGLVLSDENTPPNGAVDELDSLTGMVRDRRFQGASVSYHVEIDGRRGDAPDSVTIEITGPVGGPEAGARVRLSPAMDARLHLFAAPADPEP